MTATVSHFEIPARDPARAAGFYRRVFGWQVERLPWQGEVYFRVRTGAPPAPASGGSSGDPSSGPSGDPSGGAIQGGVTSPETVGAAHPLLVIHLHGESLADCLQRIAAAGGAVAQEPTPVGELGTFARFRDPEGNLLGLWQGTA